MTRTAHATLLEKEASAIALHAAGRNYDEIAEELGYSNRAGAWKALNRGLNTTTAVRCRRSVCADGSVLGLGSFVASSTSG
jgi:hypothetical protein